MIGGGHLQYSPCQSKQLLHLIYPEIDPKRIVIIALIKTARSSFTVLPRNYGMNFRRI